MARLVTRFIVLFTAVALLAGATSAALSISLSGERARREAAMPSSPAGERDARAVLEQAAARNATGEPAASGPAPVPDLVEKLPQIPLHFTPNRGQASDATTFLSRGDGYELRLAPTGAALELKKDQRHRTIRFEPIGMNRSTPVAEQPMPARVSEFGGSDESKWLRDLPTYGRVRYPRVYPGTDLVFYGNQERFEYDFIVSPGSDPGAIGVSLTGADRIELAPSGDLLVHVDDAVLTQQKPIVYQEIDGERHEVAAAYRLDGNRVAFDVGEYDRRHPLVIDPVFKWGYYVQNRLGDALAINSKGDVIYARHTDGDVLVIRLSSTGTFLNQSRIKGIGSAPSPIAGIVVDSHDNIIIAGTTEDDGFPTTEDAFIKERPVVKILGFIPFPWMSGAKNGYLTKLRADGNELLYSTFLGGDGDVGKFGSPCTGCSVVMKIAASIKLRWFINPGDTSITDMALRPFTNQVFVTGWTWSGAFPTTDTAVENSPVGTRFFTDTQATIVAAFDMDRAGTLSKESPAWAQAVMVYGTYLSAPCAMYPNDIYVDPWGQALVTGWTGASSFNTGEEIACGEIGATDSTMAWEGHGWLARLLSPETAQNGYLGYMTYLEEEGLAVAPRMDYGADVIQKDGNDNLKLTRLKYNRGSKISIEAFYYLGLGSNAKMKLIQYYDVSWFLSQLIAREDHGDVVVTNMDFETGRMEDIYRVPQAALRGMAVEDRLHVYLAVGTGDRNKNSLNGPQGSDENGYLVKFEHDLDPRSHENRNPNLLRISASGPSGTLQATGPHGLAGSFSAQVFYHRTQSYLDWSCDRFSPAMFPIGRTVIRCQVDMSDVEREGLMVFGGDGDGRFEFDVRVDPPPFGVRLPENINAAANSSTGREITWLAGDVKVWNVWQQVGFDQQQDVPIYQEITDYWLTCDPPSGSRFPIGATKVTCYFNRRPFPNSSFVSSFAIGSFWVTVHDNQPPAIFLSHIDLAPGVNASTLILKSGGPSGGSHSFSASGMDTIDGSVPVECRWPQGSATAYPATATFAIGASELICTAKDNAGNTTERKVRVIVDGDSDPPVLMLHVAGESSARPAELPSYSGENRPPLQLRHTVRNERSVNDGAIAYFSTSIDACTTWRAQYETTHPGSPAPACVAVTASDAFDGSREVICQTAAGDQKSLLSAPVSQLRFGNVPTFWGADVSCSAIDNGGRAATLPLTFQMWDSRPVVFSNVSPDVYTAAGDNNTARVFYEVPTAIWPATGETLSVNCGWPSGEAFPVGDTPITCRAMAPGNVEQLGEVQFAVHVSEARPALPLVDIQSGPSEDQQLPATLRTSATFTFAPRGGDRSIPAGLSLECSLDGGAYQPCQSPFGYTNLAAGGHVFEVRASGYGKKGQSNLWAWQVDPANLQPLAMPSHIVVEATGPMGAIATFALPANDAGTVTCSHASGSTFPLGTTVVSCTAGADAAGAFTVTVVDTTPPSLNLLDDQTVAAFDETGINVYFHDMSVLLDMFDPQARCASLFGGVEFRCRLDVGHDLVDGNVAVTCHDMTDGKFPIGITTLSCFAADRHGNIANDSFKITVLGESRLAITAPAAVGAEATSADGAFITNELLGQPTASGGHGDVTLRRMPSGNQFPLGETRITWTAMDGSGMVVAAEQIVTVTDTTAPAIEAPPAVTAEATNAAGAVISDATLGEPTTTDLASAVTISRTPAGNQFPIGETEVLWMAADAAGNSKITTQRVRVVDSGAPLLSLPDALAAEAADAAGARVDFVAAAMDAVDGDLAVDCTAQSGSVFPIGATLVNCTAADRSGNRSQGAFTVTVRDTIAPVLTLPAAITVRVASAGGAAVQYVVSAIDVVDGPTAVECSPASGSVMPEGTTSVRCASRDARGNAATGSFTIRVERHQLTAAELIAKLDELIARKRLDKKLQQILRSIEREKDRRACNQTAQLRRGIANDKKIAAADKQELFALVDELSMVVGCGA